MLLQGASQQSVPLKNENIAVSVPEHWPLTQDIFISYFMYALHSSVHVLEMSFVREDEGKEKPNFVSTGDIFLHLFSCTIFIFQF